MFARGARFFWGLVSGCALLAAAVPAEAASPRAVPFDIHQPSMPEALAELAREAGVELLFDPQLVQTLKARPVRGRLSADAALTALLRGSAIGHRATPDGAFVLFVIPARARPASTDDGAIAEILVVGRRTQNADIRRTENDIQPYKVASAEDIETAHSDDIDDYLRRRDPSDVQIRAPAQDPAQLGSTRSAIDLRGFGSQQTLVLVDGRRMPSVPSPQGEFDQSDLNGIPLGAIDRIETLTSSAGGIYGPSAVGGVINVVLRRDYRGADLNVDSGVTDRGDAGQVRIETRIGFTPDHGDTDIMLVGAYSASQSLLAGQRDFTERATQLAFRNDPTGFLALQPFGNAINVVSRGGPLTLNPQLGGASLGSTFTFLPLHFTGTAPQAAALLAANAGKLDLALTNDNNGTQRILSSGSTVTSGIFSVRRHLGDNVELFFDGLYYLDSGNIVAGGGDSINVVPNAVNNPFSQTVTLNFPDPAFSEAGTTTTETSRFTAGLIATLARGWRAEADYATGQSRVDTTEAGVGPSPFAFTDAIANGTAGPGALPVVNPLGSWPAFLAASTAFAGRDAVRYSLVDQFNDASLRLAGPVVQLPAGPLTLTMLAETRREHIPVSVASFDIFGDPPLAIVLPLRTKTVNSGYAELRAPLISEDAGFPLLRGLEVQFAGRYDQTETVLPDGGAPGAPSNNQLITITNGAAVFTAGARVLPTPMLMLRASVATAQLPPTVSQLQAASTLITPDGNGLADPQRGGQLAGVNGSFTLLQGGSHSVKPEEARTVTVGAVLNPSGHGGPRLSVDYSRTVTTREIRDFPLNNEQLDQLLAAPAAYPGSVVRGPLTPADAARGYTAGPIQVINLGDINAGGAVVDTVDIKLDWLLPAGRVGDFRLYGSGTWQPRYLETASQGQPAFDRVGYADGPLALRGNVGGEWLRGPLAIDLNVQYFDSYLITNSNPTGVGYTNATLVNFQGSTHIPSQFYLDLAVKRRFQVGGAPGPLKVIEARLGIQNLLDQQPPIDATPTGLGYSPYGDPRGRRFELALSAKF
jgi:iron complex outermembrane receptor protein